MRYETGRALPDVEMRQVEDSENRRWQDEAADTLNRRRAMKADIIDLI